MQIPSATYRVQFNSKFRFEDARKIVPYLHALGISHLYASPILQAKSGSQHGYDVTDPTRLNWELGSDEDFQRLTQELRNHSMGLLLDIVPNHMSSTVENPWWKDVLAQGEDSPYATYFDIDWQSSGSKFPVLQRGRVVLPFLSDYYDRLLTEGKFVLRLGEVGFTIEAEGNPFPINPKTYSFVLGRCIEALKRAPTADEDLIRSLGEIVSRVQQYSGIAAQNPAIAELWQLYQSLPAFHSVLDSIVAAFNGTKGDSASFDQLNELISAQAYRLAFWRNASDEVNYRRFFGLNELVSLRIEHDETFWDDHARIFEMVRHGQVQGLRIDHIDGLRDPMAYLQRLQKIEGPAAKQDSDALGIYTVVEKITSGRETLPAEWPTAGTTGYDYLNAVNTLFIDAAGSRKLEDIYRNFTGIRSSFGETWNVRKKQVMEEMFAADIRRLTWRLGHLAALDRLGADIPMRELVRGLKEITAALPIYRTYFRDLELLDRDRPYLTRAFEIARERAPQSAVSDAAFEFLKSVFLLRPSRDLHRYKAEWLDFLETWQQFTGAVMGKGLEDTAFFVHHGLISLNEVGTNPLRKEIAFGAPAFHRYNQRTMAEHPHTLNTTSTHDTKWSEGVRARINVLSEIPAEWNTRLRRWSEWNNAKKSSVDGRLAPSPNEELLLYQTMLGIWPLGSIDNAARAELCNRLQKFILKAAREAKTHSSWTSPNEAHENALKRFLCSILDASLDDPFFADFTEFVGRIVPAGICNSCAQVLLKIASPGVPDFYQGNELWDLRLTDPDNRNPVDFEIRGKLLFDELLKKSADAYQTRASLDAADLLNNWQDGRLKLFLTREALNFRRARRELFLSGGYLPLEASGAHRQSICAFARRLESEWAMVVVPRMVSALPRDGVFPLGLTSWGSNTISLPLHAPARWKDIFTGEEIEASRAGRRKALPVASILSRLPFALLTTA